MLKTAEDEAIELVNKWLSAQKNKNINKLLTITDPIGTEALIRSFYKKGNTYRIKDFDDNYYIVKKEYNNNAEKNDYNSVDDYIKEQFNSLYTQITYTNFKINKLENLSKVSETNNIYTIDFKAKITYNISQNDNEVSISLKGPLYLIKKDGKFRILGTYDDLTSLSELY